MDKNCLTYGIEISNSDWEGTPARVKQLVKKIGQHIKQSEKELADLAALRQEPRGEHSKLAGSLAERLLIVIREMGKGGIWTIPRESIVKPFRDKSGYEPDIIVLNEKTIDTETRWEAESVIQNATSVKLIVEVVSQCVARVPRVEATDVSAALASLRASPVRVSTNWQDDYYDKRRDYESMGIPEYWIVDYAGLGGREFIGYPKSISQPSRTVKGRCHPSSETGFRISWRMV